VSRANPDGSEGNRIRRSHAVHTRGVHCANPACADRGPCDKGNIRIHSRKERRFRCLACGKTFAASSGTPFHRLH